ncbi:hypothetical protein BDZ45DRAFT_748880 [Acephala macrosclerotiorum]|nr:hypothetical protein BDZ45DRAFT_748880 [Acephala macrosclerotiorum]
MIITAIGYSVYGIHVNGFIFALAMMRSPIENAALTPELPTTEAFRRKPAASQRTSTTTATSIPQMASPKPVDILWEDTLTGPDTSHEVGLAQQDDIHEMSATLKVPFSDK